MTKANDPAFTGLTSDGPTSGLTKREYFAAMAMQALTHKSEFWTDMRDISEKAIQIADTLIEKLNQQL